jgi:hypothetical protein
MVVEALSDPRSVFEGSQAVEAMFAMSEMFEDDEREQVMAAANNALEKGMITAADRQRLTSGPLVADKSEEQRGSRREVQGEWRLQ